MTLNEIEFILSVSPFFFWSTNCLDSTCIGWEWLVTPTAHSFPKLAIYCMMDISLLYGNVVVTFFDLKL